MKSSNYESLILEFKVRSLNVLSPKIKFETKFYFKVRNIKSLILFELSELIYSTTTYIYIYIYIVINILGLNGFTGLV